MAKKKKSVPKKKSGSKPTVHVTEAVAYVGDGEVKNTKIVRQYSYAPRKDAVQTALSIVEQVTGGKLKPSG